jgi:hypothetical protein
MKTIKVSRSAFYSFSFLFGIYTILLGLLAFAIVLDDKTTFDEFQTFLFLNFIATIMFGFFAYKMKIVLKLNEIQVFDNRIEIIYKKSKDVILFQDIKRFEVSKSKYKTISCEIHTDLQSFNFNHQTIQYGQMNFFVEALYKSRPDLLENGIFAEVRAKHSVVPGNSAISFMIAAVALILTFAYFGYVFQSNKYYFKGFSDFILGSEYGFYGVILFPFVMASFFLSSAQKKITVKITESLKKNPSKSIQEEAFSRSVLYKAFGTVSIVFMVYFSLFFKFDVNLLSYIDSNVDIPYMNLKADDSVWVDLRYSCEDCNLKLNLGARIAYGFKNSPRLGIIVGLPQEQVVINVDKKSRRLASAELVIVPSGEFAVHTGESDQQVRLIPQKFIRGKVLKKLSDFF